MPMKVKILANRLGKLKLSALREKFAIEQRTTYDATIKKVKIAAITSEATDKYNIKL